MRVIVGARAFLRGAPSSPRLAPLARFSFAVAVAAEAAAGAAVLSVDLGGRGFVFAETATFAYAHQGFAGLLRAIRSSDAFFAVYYAIMHLWLSLGSGEAAMRSFSVLCGTALVVAIAFLTRQLGGTRAGVVAGALTAASPFVFDLGHEARPYALLVLLSAVASGTFVAALRAAGAGGSRWGPYAAVCAAGCAVDLFLFNVVIAHAVWAVLVRPQGSRRGMALTVAAVAVPVIPLLWVMKGYGPIDAYLTRPTPHELIDTCYWFAGSRPVAVALVAAAAAGALVVRRREPLPRDLALFLAAAFFVPLAVCFGASYLVRPVYAARYVVEAWPAAIVGLALLIARLPPAAGVPVVAAIASLSVATTFRGHLATIQDWRGAVRLIAAEARPSDALVVFPKRGTVPLAYYRRGDPAPEPPLLYPDRVWFPLVQGQDTVEAPVLRLPSPLPPRIWVLEGWADLPATGPALAHFLAPLRVLYRRPVRRPFARVVVLRFDRR